MRLDKHSTNAVAQIDSKVLLSEEYKRGLSSKRVEMTEKLHLNILQLLPEPMLIATPDEVIFFANHAARVLFSPTGDDLQGTPFNSFLAHRSEKFNHWIQKATCSPTFVSEQIELKTFRGTIPFQLDGCAVRDGKHCCVLIRLKAIDAKQPTVHALSVRVDKLQQEIAMRRAAEERLNESLIELERAKKQLEQLATIDSLTDIPNRRSIDETLQREWLKAMRTSEPLALMMIDIDHFKNYNDYYGHQAGDECLRKVAQAIRASLRRPTDYVGRYGGEEFIVLLTHSDWEKTKHMAEKILESVRLLKLPHHASPTAEIVTISAGVNIVIPTPKLSVSSLIHQADEALYQAKHSGRNQFVLHQKPVKAILRRKKSTPISSYKRQ
ncbi:MAG: diguanylate cyclase domain-containing protein [Chlorobiales bacterium]